MDGFQNPHQYILIQKKRYESPMPISWNRI